MATVLPLTPGEAIDVGTLDVSTGFFDGLVTETIQTAKGTKRVTPIASISGRKAFLTFGVANWNGPFTVTTRGATHRSSSGSPLSVDVGDATRLAWTLKAGTRSYHDSLVITRTRPVSYQHDDHTFAQLKATNVNEANWVPVADAFPYGRSVSPRWLRIKLPAGYSPADWKRLLAHGPPDVVERLTL